MAINNLTRLLNNSLSKIIKGENFNSKVNMKVYHGDNFIREDGWKVVRGTVKRKNGFGGYRYQTCLSYTFGNKRCPRWIKDAIGLNKKELGDI